MTTLFIFIFLFIIGLGFRLIYKDRNEQTKTLDFTNEFRNKFVDLSNKYFAGHSSFPKTNELDEELYHWLTKNSVMMQSDLGRFGII